jgi:hypothetical protein
VVIGGCGRQQRPEEQVELLVVNAWVVEMVHQDGDLVALSLLVLVARLIGQPEEAQDTVLPKQRDSHFVPIHSHNLIIPKRRQ